MLEAAEPNGYQDPGNQYSMRQFDHEKLEVYQLELKFLTWVTGLLDELRKRKNQGLRDVIDQLDRASLSALLNTAEGNGKRSTKQRARYFDDARGSATEYAACLDAIVTKRATTDERVEAGKRKLLRIVSMLTKLVERFDGSASRLQEDASDCNENFKDKDDQKPQTN